MWWSTSARSSCNARSGPEWESGPPGPVLNGIELAPTVAGFAESVGVEEDPLRRGEDEPGDGGAGGAGAGEAQRECVLGGPGEFEVPVRAPYQRSGDRYESAGVSGPT